MHGKRKCAYCGSIGPLTKEHLWPGALAKRVGKLSNSVAAYWTVKLNKQVDGDLTIRDVCATCNNTYLSELDKYVIDLFDSQLHRFLERDEEIVLEYDHHQLKRWLLKMSFNSARANDSSDVGHYSPFIPYIMGQSEASGRSVLLYAQLTYPGNVPTELVSANVPPVYYPTTNRVGFFWFTPPRTGHKLMRAIHIHSYTFFLALFEPNESRAALDAFDRVFREHMMAAVHLRASLKKVHLKCNGADAWESISEGYGNSLLFRYQPTPAR